VKSKEELKAALDLAFSEADSVMCEAFVQGRELTCGVIRLNGVVQALPICEIRTSHEFFDYRSQVPCGRHAGDRPRSHPRCRNGLGASERSEAIYRALQCNGMVRVDHFWKEGQGDGTEVVTIEVNTVPGFSPASIFPKMLNRGDRGAEGGEC
jgi:D-alanine-D-alanine ligase